MLPVSEYSKPPKIIEKGCLRARIHYSALKFQELAILTCAHGYVFSMHKNRKTIFGLFSLLTKIAGDTDVLLRIGDRR